MASDIVYEATFRHAPELVWRALTTPAALSAWLMQNDLTEPRVGARFKFTDRPRPFWDGICECEVVEADEPRRFVLRWGMNTGTETRVEWTLTPVSDGQTRVAFRHSGLVGPMGWMMKLGMSKGWRRMMDRSIPFVLAEMANGAIPTREVVRERAGHSQ